MEMAWNDESTLAKFTCAAGNPPPVARRDLESNDSNRESGNNDKRQ